ncbi:MULTISPECIES: hypothetical protein [Bacillus]|uniref:hypothetical protein n=1 Tax=Bacillus TaxID=1386 RepID=UPI00081C8125|nr:hypothetical protein [Bacillus subtilis]AOA54541.1 hypothetical protein BSHJ0_01969 [Bacillus subtilis]RXM08234.1 hypothetical protein ETL41_00125 [Bacillus subtilis]RXM08378.1 hypothetical protein ETL41_00950 [Bacillus subtilis]UVV91354.1 hypothetical protein NX810_10100 [Bacillus subtilis]
MSHSFSIVLSKKLPLRMLIKRCEIDFNIQLDRHKQVMGFSSGVHEDLGLFLTISSRQIDFRFLNSQKFVEALGKVEQFIEKQFHDETVGVIYHDNMTRLKDIPTIKIINLS